MPLYSVIVVNTDNAVNDKVEKVLSVSSCSDYICRLQIGSTAAGPFDVYINSISSVPLYTGLTRSQMFGGVVITLDCTEEIELLTQNGDFVLFQNSKNFILQQLVTIYSVSSGESVCSSASFTLNNKIYSSSINWNNVNRFFSDESLSLPFDGNNKWYSNTIDGCGGMIQIDSLGYTNNSYCDPCP